VAEGQNLDLECGFGLPAADKEVEQGADDGVEEAQDHGQGSWSGRMSALPVSRRSSEAHHRGPSTFLNGTGVSRSWSRRDPLESLHTTFAPLPAVVYKDVARFLCGRS
jgi:hypothetical protein